MVYGLIVLTVNHPCNKLRTRNFNEANGYGTDRESEYGGDRA